MNEAKSPYQSPSSRLKSDSEKRSSSDYEVDDDAVDSAAYAVLNRSSADGDKRPRRRSRRSRQTPTLAGMGLKFHYLVGGLLVVSLILVSVSNKISIALWRATHVQKVSIVAPWWFRIEIPAILLGILVWLYLTPGIWDAIKAACGLKKDDDRRSRRRHD